MPGGGTITIGARCTQAHEVEQSGLQRGEYVVLSVADTGQGMDAATLARAAEPFFTTKGAGKGTGLGLSMVQGLAEQSGGRLVLSSLPGHGTTVAIWLPVSRDTQASARTAHAHDHDHATPELKKARILVVDDDPLVRVSATALLDDIGYDVLDADGGMRALELIAAHPDIGLVLTDQVMPEMTGIQLINAIHELRPELPVILATGYAELSSPLPAHTRRLAKPFRPGELLECIAAALA
jgi:CheY-like chemotaxis protein